VARTSNRPIEVLAEALDRLAVARMARPVERPL
jgi:hypothetical protein